MKKILLCMLLAGLMMPSIAQEKKVSLSHCLQTSALQTTENMKVDCNVIDNNASSIPTMPIMRTKSIVNGDIFDYAIPESKTMYDMQSQGSMYNLMAVHDDGFIGAVWTSSMVVSDPKTRGIAYSCSRDGGYTWENATQKIGNVSAYWASYAQWGEKGEIVLARTNKTISDYDGLVIIRRATKGEGEWERIDVPYPSDAPYTDANGYVMAWARIMTSGQNHEYVHIVTGMGVPEGTEYHGMKNPVMYTRSSDGGSNWDLEWKTFPELTGVEWNSPTVYYPEKYAWAEPQGSNLTLVMAGKAEDGRIFRSPDHGETWTESTFFTSYFDTNDTYEPDSLRPRPSGTNSVALDKDGRVHIAFSINTQKNAPDVGYYSYGTHYVTGMLGYWNENRDPYDTIFFMRVWEDWLEQYFKINDDGSPDYNTIVGSLNKYIIGQAIPLDEDPEEFIWGSDYEWNAASYDAAVTFAFPSLMIDPNGRIHVVYAGMKDDGIDQDDHQYRHLYYTYSDDGGETWSSTLHLQNVLMDENEYAYPYAKIHGRDIVIFSQVDNLAGKYASPPTSGEGIQESVSENEMHVIVLKNFIEPYENIDEGDTEKQIFSTQIYPNPATSSSKVTFNGKATVEVYNVVGKLVHKAENITNQYDLPVNELEKGAYLVTVRNGNKVQTQKLIIQ